MRIIQLCQKPQLRGAERFASMLAHRLGARGHQVLLLYLYPGTERSAPAAACATGQLDGTETSRLERSLGWHPKLLRRLQLHIDEFEPQVLQANGARTLKYGALAAGKAGAATPYLIYRNIGDPQAWIAGWRRRLFYRTMVAPRVQGVVSVASAFLEPLRRTYRAAAIHRWIPNGIEPELLAPELPREGFRHATGLSGEASVVLYAGSLTREKRVDRLLTCIAPIRSRVPDLRLWIVGEGPLLGKLMSLAAKLGLDRLTRFWGAREDIASLMSAADVLALASDTEGCPAVVLEAGYLGLPVVATRVGGLPEMVVQGETGLLVDRHDERAFSAALSRLLKQPAEAREMGRRAHRRVTDLFAMERIAAEYEELYATLLEPTHRPPQQLD